MPSQLFHNKYIRLAIVAGLVVIFDQITKALILNYLPLGDSVRVIRGAFNIVHVHNPGGAFGFMAGMSDTVRNVVFLFISAVAVGFVFFFYKNIPVTQGWLSFGLALIFGGAVGNLIDRIRFGSVVDFLDFYLGRWHWPAFNVADSAISIGVVIFLFHMIFKKMPARS